MLLLTSIVVFEFRGALQNSKNYCCALFHGIILDLDVLTARLHGKVS